MTTRHLAEYTALSLMSFVSVTVLTANEPAPPLPKQFASTELQVPLDELWSAAVKRNPRLQRMAVEVRAAESNL